MYLKIEKNIDLVKLGKLLLPEATRESLDWDYENVYEWMYVDFPGYDFSLNVSREHGMADVDDEVLEAYQHDDEALRKVVSPGSIYIICWDRIRDHYIDEIPEELIETICDRLQTDILVYPGRINSDLSDTEPISLYKAKEPSST